MQNKGAFIRFLGREMKPKFVQFDAVVCLFSAALPSGPPQDTSDGLLQRHAELSLSLDFQIIKYIVLYGFNAELALRVADILRTISPELYIACPLVNLCSISCLGFIKEK